MATPSLAPIVSPEWLLDALASPPADGLVVADARWYLDGRPARPAFEAEHIAGAVFVDMDGVLAAHGTPQEGRHPLPSPEVFAAGLAAVGIGPATTVVAYDDLEGRTAGRLAWMLRILGSEAALLDGGLGAWTGPRATGPSPDPAQPVDHPARPWPDDAIVDADAVTAHIRNGGVVADARAPERFRGETEPVDPRAGHVPGAISVPFDANLGPDGRFRPPEELAARFTASGVDGDAILYCGSGVSACHNVLAAEAAGLGRPRLYVGSWSQWSSDPDRLVATGDA